MSGRPTWFHRGHPPTCSCVDCVEQRLSSEDEVARMRASARTRVRREPEMARRGESPTEARRAVRQGLRHYQRRRLVRGTLRILAPMALGAAIVIVLALWFPSIAQEWLEKIQEVIARLN